MATAALNGQIHRIEEIDHQGQDLNAEIPGAHCDQVFRCLQQPQKRLGKGDQRGCQHNADGNRHGIHRCHPMAHRIVITPAIGFRDLDAAAHSQTAAQGGDHGGDLAQAGHGGYRIGADMGCHHGIENFKHALQRLEQRQGRAGAQQHLHRRRLQRILPKGLIFF